MSSPSTSCNALFLYVINKYIIIPILPYIASVMNEIIVEMYDIMQDKFLETFNKNHRDKSFLDIKWVIFELLLISKTVNRGKLKKSARFEAEI